MPSVTINSEDPAILAQLEEIRLQAQAKQKKSPARLEQAKKRKFKIASRTLVSTLSDLYQKFDAKMTGKHVERHFVDVDNKEFFEVTIAVRRRTRQAIEGTEYADNLALFNDEVEANVFEILKGLNQKESLSKQEFQSILADVDGYDAAMWTDLKSLLEKDPKSSRGRGTKFYPRKPKKNKSKKK